MRYGVDLNKPEDLPDVLPLELVKAACEWGDARGVTPKGYAFVQDDGKCACLAGLVGMYMGIPVESTRGSETVGDEHRGDLLESVGYRFFPDSEVFDWFDCYAVKDARNWAEVYDLYCQELDEMED